MLRPAAPHSLHRADSSARPLSICSVFPSTWLCFCKAEILLFLPKNKTCLQKARIPTQPVLKVQLSPSPPLPDPQDRTHQTEVNSQPLAPALGSWAPLVLGVPMWLLIVLEIPLGSTLTRIGAAGGGRAVMCHLCVPATCPGPH